MDPTHRRWDALTLALAPLVATAPAVALSLSTGSWGTSWTDDWGYIASINTLFSHHPSLVGYGDMSLLGLLAAGRVATAVIHGTATLDAVELVAAAVAAFALDVIGQRMQVRRADRLLVLAIVIFATPWTELATSFLTDIPSLALGLSALAVAIIARPSRGALLATTVLAVAGFTVRETSLVLGLPAVAAAALRLPAGGRRFAIGVAGAAVVACAAFWIYRHGLPGQQRWTDSVGGVTLRFDQVARALLTLAAILSPLVALRARLPRDRLERALVGAAMIFALLFVARRAVRGGRGFGVNYFGYELLHQTNPTPLVQAATAALSVAGMLAFPFALVLLVDIARMFKRRPADVGALAVWGVALISPAFLIVRGVGGSQLFDRYYIEAVAPLALGVAALPRGALARAGTRALSAVPMAAPGGRGAVLGGDRAGRRARGARRGVEARGGGPATGPHRRGRRLGRRARAAADHRDEAHAHVPLADLLRKPLPRDRAVPAAAGGLRSSGGGSGAARVWDSAARAGARSVVLQHPARRRLLHAGVKQAGAAHLRR